MYQQHFGLTELPFTLTPNTHFFLNLPTHQEAFNLIMVALENGDGFVKIVGEVGTGKTLLCRKVLNSLGGDFVSAYIPNPRLTAIELKRAVAKELAIQKIDEVKDRDLLEVINQRLLELAGANKSVVLVIDEAQALPEDSIEELRLLTNLETEQKKLMQIVLFAQPELDEILSQHHFRQLRQRITFSHTLDRLNKVHIHQYINHRMSLAGYNGEPVFDNACIRLLHKATHGSPRLINIVCGKALLIAFSQGQQKVEKRMVKTALDDTEGVSHKTAWLFG